MAASARIRHLRVTPRKARLVADIIRGKKVQQALDLLVFCKRYVAKDFRKLVKSAWANADQKGTMDPDNLVVKTVMVDVGPTLKRSMPRAKGSATPLLKRTCHITLILDEK